MNKKQKVGDDLGVLSYILIISNKYTKPGWNLIQIKFNSFESMSRKKSVNRGWRKNKIGENQ